MNTQSIWKTRVILDKHKKYIVQFAKLETGWMVKPLEWEDWTYLDDELEINTPSFSFEDNAIQLAKEVYKKYNNNDSYEVVWESA